MDSPIVNGFSTTDQEWCEKIIRQLETESDFSRLIKYYE